MLSIKQVFLALFCLNCLFLLVFFTGNSSPESLVANTQAHASPTSRQLTANEPDDDSVNASDDKDEKKSDDDDDDDDSDEKHDDTDDKKDKKQKNNNGKDKKKNLGSKTQKKGSSKDQERDYRPKKSENKRQEPKHPRLKKIKNEIRELQEQLDTTTQRSFDMVERRDKVQKALRWSNPFFLLGAYPKIGNEYFNSYPDGRPFYDDFNYGLINDADYCELVDLYNIAHPENMFESMNFFTDYAKNGLTRSNVIRKIGVDTMRQVSKYMKKKEFNTAQYHLNPMITNYFTKRVDIHIYHTIGKHFNCATQMYNHIPGHGVLKRKDLIVDSVDNYAARFESEELSHCFNKHKFFPYSYRLYLEDECEAFFEHINSNNYIKSLEQEPIQFVIKLGYGAHRAKGVFIFDKNETEVWKEFYDNGAKCGAENKSIIAQTYITNPLLLDLNNKFDFRVYMLVASTNPLIVYYHDGFLRVSLEIYDKYSSDKSVHLTNTHLSKEKFAAAEADNITILGMNAEELRDYQMWTFERLGEHLHKEKGVPDDWIEKTLKPNFYEAFIHTVRMSAHAFWNQSNVYEMFGLDFMLDEELNLWFIECNSSPQLIGTNDLKTKFLTTMLKDLFEIQYGLYRSRMNRVMNVLQRINKQSYESGRIDYTKWREEYAEASRNRFDPDYKIKPTNSFKLIMDMNLEGPEAYFGHLQPECATH